MGAPVLAIDATVAGELPPPAALASAVARLRALPCPSVALVTPGPRGALADLCAACDVVVETRAELEHVVTAIARTPLAAAALVAVLRAGDGMMTASGLVVESLAYAALQGGAEFAAWLATRRPSAGARADGTPAVTVERADDRLLVTLDRPERHNAFSAAMRDGLVEALTVAAGDPTVASVLLRGNGPSFCSGGDLAEFGTTPDPATAHAVRMTRSPARLLAAVADRVQVEVHGACIGAGIELAAFAAQVAARPDAFFQLPEVGMGLVPGAGGTVSIPRRIGRQRTAWLALTGDRIDAATAHAWGLVDAIADGR